MRCAEATGIVTVKASHEQVHVRAITAILNGPAVTTNCNPFERSQQRPDTAALVAKLTEHQHTANIGNDERHGHEAPFTGRVW